MNQILKTELEKKGKRYLPKILLVASECAPLAKTGGLADVVGTLPKSLKKLGMDARVIIPYHRIIKDRYRSQVVHMFDFYCDLGWRREYVGIEKLELDGVIIYLVDNEGYFGDKIYRGGLPETTAKRAIHPIGEDERVLLGAQLLEKGDLAGFGALMFDSHESSRSWFENSCAELDTIVDAAKAIPEVLGARLSGGGFGGSCCLLVKPEAADQIAAAITQAYKTAYGDEPVCRLVKPSDGAHLV